MQKQQLGLINKSHSLWESIVCRGWIVWLPWQPLLLRHLSSYGIFPIKEAPSLCSPVLGVSVALRCATRTLFSGSSCHLAAGAVESSLELKQGSIPQSPPSAVPHRDKWSSEKEQSWHVEALSLFLSLSLSLPLSQVLSLSTVPNQLPSVKCFKFWNLKWNGGVCFGRTIWFLLQGQLTASILMSFPPGLLHLLASHLCT